MYIRPKFHITPNVGWINDPNGFSYYNGKFHCFAQHNPYDTKWGPMHWIHFISDDLITWKEVGIAMKPDEAYDIELGCWSGHAYVENNVHHLFYTAANHGIQRQCLATSIDGINYKKYSKNPIISDVPNGFSIKDARDPKVVKVNDLYYLVIASKKENGTSLLLYVGKDFDSFEFKSELYSIESDEWCILECPDIIFYEDKCMLIYSLNHKVNNKYEGLVYYVTGEFDHSTFSFKNTAKPQLIDYGFDFYAHETMIHESKIYLIAWHGGVCKTSQKGYDGYSGQLTMVRELKIQNNEVLQRFLPKLDEKCHEVMSVTYQNLSEGFMSPYLDMHYRLKGEFKFTQNSILTIQLNVGFTIEINKETRLVTVKRTRNQEEIYYDDGSLLLDRSFVIKEDIDDLNIDIVFDGYCVDILINDGRYSFTSNYFGESKIGLVSVRCKNEIVAKSLAVYNLK